jgi:hypothetical protein
MASLIRSKYYENLLEILSNEDEATKKIKINDYLGQFSSSGDKSVQKYSENLIKSECRIIIESRVFSCKILLSPNRSRMVKCR